MNPASRTLPGPLATATFAALAPRVWYFPTMLAVLLAVIAQVNFLVFHTLAELFAIVVSFVLFALAWYTHRFARDPFLIYLACGLFWIGALDIAHTLTYKGMGLLKVDEANMATQIWIGARYLQALLMLTAPLAARWKVNKLACFAIFGLIAVLTLAIVISRHFPDAFVEGEGLTAFKVNSEYVIMAILALALALLWRGRDTIALEALPYLALAIVLSIATELAFTLYVDVYGLSNLVGHTFKLFAFWAIFQAVVVANLIRPWVALADSNRAKDDFLASMSHDLRTPLNSILGFADMIRSQMFGPVGNRRYEEYIGNIHASGTHLLGLVNDILDLSKLGSGKYQLVRQPLDPQVLSDEVIRSFAPDISAKKLQSVVHCPPGAGPLWADERAMVQLLNNLVSNAVKFTPAGGCISIEWTQNQHGGLSLAIRDSGRGIPDDKLGLLGQPYVQIDPYVARQHHGTGLGLFIVRRIADLHGATLRIESAEGAGTTVTVTFPAAPADV